MSRQVAPAVKIEGCESKYKLINGTYERLPHDHNGHAAFVLRDATPCYIFHTGKSRWVISKRIDDGQRCYAFRKDEPASENPSKCSGPWTTCGGSSAKDQEWTADNSIKCSQVAGSNDMFVQLRLTIMDEMKKLGIGSDVNNLKQLWRRLDFNGNNVVSLAEVDKLVVEMTAGGAWPEWLNNKPALMRAFQKSKGGVDGRRGDFVEKCEFSDLLLNIFWFNKLFKVFDDIDTDDDRRINLEEFTSGIGKLGLKLSGAEAEQKFKEIDTNNGGEVLFVEFCAYIRKRVNPDDNPAFDSDIVSGEKAGTTLRKTYGSKATQNHFVQKKTMSMFDDVEKKIKDVISANDQAALKKMWQHLDFNGNGKVSLAEIDKFVIESYPILNHKPALMRAYKKTIKDGDGDDWVEKKEFKSLLGNLIYFNKLFWLFDVGDQDRRMDFEEFKIALVNAGVKMAEGRAKQEFKKCDKDGGGKILFDEFCAWFVNRECPDAMTQFISPGEQ